MGLARVTDVGEYARHLRKSAMEVSALADDLLIHVTGFFRDPEAWEALRQKVVAPMMARREPEGEVRAWVTACSSGEEAYTLAMVLAEEAERAAKPLGIKVFATDMAERTLDQARAGVYPDGIEAEVDPGRLEKFFEKDGGHYRVRQYLRECVVFAPQNMLTDPPFSRLDIVSCRNLLIYLEPEHQRRVLSLLHFGLREGGALFLGSSETIARAEELYEVVDKRARIYRRVGPTRYGDASFPLPHAIGRAAATSAAGGGDKDAERNAAGAGERHANAPDCPHHPTLAFPRTPAACLPVHRRSNIQSRRIRERVGRAARRFRVFHEGTFPGIGRGEPLLRARQSVRHQEMSKCSLLHEDDTGVQARANSARSCRYWTLSR